MTKQRGEGTFMVTMDQKYEGAVEELERLEAENERLKAALRKIADGDPTQVYSPIGPLHAAGIVCQWEIDAKICREALGHEPSVRPVTDSRDEDMGPWADHIASQARMIASLTTPQAPIAKIIVRESGAAHYAPDLIDVKMYAPGLPPGEHDVYCAPESVAPMMMHTREAREPSEPLKECPYCHKPADGNGGIWHAGGCAGLEEIKMNRLPPTGRACACW